MTPGFTGRLRRGQVVTLVNADHASASVVTALGAAGVDAIMIDCEQGVAGLVDVEHMAMAARLAGFAAIVRVPSAQPWVLERYLHRGIDGVVIPRLDHAYEVAAAVATIRYHWPADHPDHADKAVVVQVESTGAVDDLDGFLAVAGVDCFFVGPVDLARSMGVRDHTGHDVTAAIAAVLGRVTGAGRRCGLLVDEGNVAEWLRHGVTMLYTHVDDFVAIGARVFRTGAGLDRS